jgi:formamidopyrimidine-DNA glycosylase
MPELPDVEVFRRRLVGALDKRIDAVAVQNRRVLAGLAPGRLQADLAGHRFRAARRHGKHLFAQIDAGPWLAMHFGMTGEIKYFTGDDPTPDFDRLRIDFVNGAHLAYYDPRLLGRLRLIDDPDRFIADKPLGPDALDPDFDYRGFTAVLDGARCGIKALLMDQTTIAGIGNIYSDEILFQARIHPQTKVGDLDARARQRLYRAMKAVLKKAIAREADPDRLPSNYLIPHRRAGERCPRCGGNVARVALGGRSSYFCPRCQPPPRPRKVKAGR